MPIRIGTRGSALAVTQSTAIAKALERLGERAELVEIVTSGDRQRAVGDKGRFVKEIEQALLDREVDLAVHSAKDVPGEIPDGLEIAAVPKREDPRDALCGAASLDDLRERAVVGTASLRRRSQLLALRPDLDVRELRGNVDTRLRRLHDGDFDAIVLAAAGLVRLGRSGEGTPLGLEALTPAAGQGCLALECRGEDEAVRRSVSALADRDASAELAAERALVAAIEATCDTPVGAHATARDGSLTVRAYVGAADGSTWIRDELDGTIDEATELGGEIGRRLLAAGAAPLVAGTDPT